MKNYSRILHKVLFEPWLITPLAHAAIRQLIESRATQEAAFHALREGVDMCGEKVELDQMEIIDGVAHIPIAGVIGYKLSGFEKGGGAVDILDIRDEIKVAMADPEVHSIIMDIDSPGGTVAGVPELADLIASIDDKPVYAFTAGMMCSAAYWIAAQADLIFATQSSDIGSIGVYQPWYDTTKAYDDMGVKVDLITSGAYKGMGYPGTALTEKQRELLQQQVNEIFAMFKQAVTRNRPAITDETMQGQSFLAPTALTKDLIDVLVQDREDMLRQVTLQS